MAAAIGFAERFAFVRFLRAMGRLSPESDRELAAALGVGESWIRKWKTRADAPEGRVVMFLYVPATIMVLLRPNEGTVPAWLERSAARWPAWLRGRPVIDA